MLRCQSDGNAVHAAAMQSFKVQCSPRFKTSAILTNDTDVDGWARFASTYHEVATGHDKHHECTGYPAAVSVQPNLGQSDRRDLDTVRSYLLYRGYDELECGKIVGLGQVKMVQQSNPSAFKSRNYHIRKGTTIVKSILTSTAERISAVISPLYAIAFCFMLTQRWRVLL